MSRGEDKQRKLHNLVTAILETGTPVSSVITMFSETLRDLGYRQESSIISELADITRESED